MYKEEKIVFYDGDCGFCNRTVQFILKKNNKKNIKFAALQSETAKKLFSHYNFPEPDLSTFYFFEGEKLTSKSSGALALTKHLVFPYLFFGFFKIIPKRLRDKMYDFIADRRHKLAVGFCALPTEEEKKRFLR
jgi:predicted DCC family thiol-disulfide oxidoreductase YuxK